MKILFSNTGFHQMIWRERERAMSYYFSGMKNNMLNVTKGRLDESNSTYWQLDRVPCVLYVMFSCWLDFPPNIGQVFYMCINHMQEQFDCSGVPEGGNLSMRIWYVAYVAAWLWNRFREFPCFFCWKLDFLRLQDPFGFFFLQLFHPEDVLWTGSSVYL